jgi:hypothetical protein
MEHFTFSRGMGKNSRDATEAQGEGRRRGSGRELTAGLLRRGFALQRISMFSPFRVTPCTGGAEALTPS